MPAKSIDQQRSAGIALQAKKEGTVNELPKGSASLQMAKSMSKKELEKLAGTKHKGLPKDVDKKNESNIGWLKANKILENWEKALMVQEEMLGIDDEDGQIVTQKSKPERVRKKGKRKKRNKDAWPSGVSAIANHGRHALSTNTAGARVAEQRTFETEWEEDEWFDPPEQLINWSEATTREEEEMIEHLMFHHKKYGTPPSSWDAEDLFNDVSGYFPLDNEQKEMAYRAIETAEDLIDWTKKECRNPNSLDIIFEQEDEDPTKLLPPDETLDNLLGGEGDDDDMGDDDIDEAMLGGVANTSPNPGHRAKMNEK